MCVHNHTDDLQTRLTVAAAMLCNVYRERTSFGNHNDETSTSVTGMMHISADVHA